MSLLAVDLISLLAAVFPLLSIVSTGFFVFSGIAGLSLAVDDGCGCLPLISWFRWSLASVMVS
jgi:hypothetical protein